MRILYFCEEYFCNHGARTHGREFFGALKSLPEVNYAIVMSRWNKPTQDNEDIIIRNKQGKGRFTFLPPTLHKFLGFFRPRPEIAEQIIRQAAKENIDILIVRSGRWNIPYTKIKKACPHIILCLEINAFVFDEHFHDIWFRPFWQRLEVQLLRHADCFVTVSSYLKDYLVRKGIEEERILVNPNGVNVKLFGGIHASERNIVRKQLEIPEKAFVLGYIGGMEPFRRLPEMAEAVADLRRQGENDIYLLIISNGSHGPLVTQTIQENQDSLDGWVSCLGRQPYEQIPFLMAAFDLAIFPFTNPYCSPLKLFEYLAMGLPTIGPDTPAVREIFEDGKHLLLVSQSGSDFKEAIVTLKNSPDLRKQLAMNGREKVLNSYTWLQNAKRVLDHAKKFGPLRLVEDIQIQPSR